MRPEKNLLLVSFRIHLSSSYLRGHSILRRSQTMSAPDAKMGSKERDKKHGLLHHSGMVTMKGIWKAQVTRQWMAGILGA